MGIETSVLKTVPGFMALGVASNNLGWLTKPKKMTGKGFIKLGTENFIGIGMTSAVASLV